MTPLERLAKSERAAASARLLLETADADGAANRAYHAMLDMALVVLHARGSVSLPRTHESVKAAFGLACRDEPTLGRDTGRLFARALEARLAADYGVSTPLDVAALIVSDMTTMRARCIAFLRERIPDQVDGAGTTDS